MKPSAHNFFFDLAQNAIPTDDERDQDAGPISNGEFIFALAIGVFLVGVFALLEKLFFGAF